jgi:hypothetical protein
MLRRVALAGTDVSEEHVTSIRVSSIGELGTRLAVTSNVASERPNTVGAGGVTFYHSLLVFSVGFKGF